MLNTNELALLPPTLIQMWENYWFAFKIDNLSIVKPDQSTTHLLLSAVVYMSGQMQNFPNSDQSQFNLSLLPVDQALGNSLDISDLRSLSFHL